MALAALSAVYRSDDRIAWFHLGAGRSISEHGLPSREMWCLAGQGARPWLSEWLFQVSLYQTHRVAGDLGVAAWRATFAALAMALVIAILRVLGALNWTAALLAPLALAIARDRFEPRPDGVILCLVLFAVLSFERARAGTDRTRWLIPAQTLWANLQASWILGPVIAWVYAAAAWWDERTSAAAAGVPATEAALASSPGPVTRSTMWGALGLVLWAASAIVPAPLETLARPLRFLVDGGLDPLTGAVPDMRPWSWGADRGQPFTALLVLGAGGLLLGASRVWRVSPGLATLSFLSLLLGIVGFRFRGLAALLALVTLAIALAPSGEGMARVLWRAPTAVAFVGGMGWLLFSPSHPFGMTPRLESLPVGAVALADSLALPGPVLNRHPEGGYLLSVRGDRHPPLIDPRVRATREFLALYIRAHRDPLALDSLAEVWRFDHAVLPPPTSQEDRLPIELSRRLEWARVYQDDGGVLFVRWSRHPAVARARAYRYLSPEPLAMLDLLERCRADTGLARRLVAELERARAESPWHARASLWLGTLAEQSGDPAQAVVHFDEAERIAPELPGLALRQGLARERVGDLAGARRAYRRALREPDDEPIARSQLEGLR